MARTERMSAKRLYNNNVSCLTEAMMNLSPSLPMWTKHRRGFENQDSEAEGISGALGLKSSKK